MALMRFLLAFLLLATPAMAGPLSITAAVSVHHVAGYGTVVERACRLEFYDRGLKLVAVLPRGGKPKAGGVVCA